ncbi:MAG: hypothetical protein ACRD8W_07675 [Nitrososphaeraceae archaeon]
MQNRRGEYLFADRTYDNTVHFTLVDRKGHIIRSDDLPITIEVFEKSVLKSGYKYVSF